MEEKNSPNMKTEQNEKGHKYNKSKGAVEGDQNTFSSSKPVSQQVHRKWGIRFSVVA